MSFEKLAVEYARQIAGREEALVKAWLAEHGRIPSECCIVRQASAEGLRMWVSERLPTEIEKENAALSKQVQELEQKLQNLVGQEVGQAMDCWEHEKAIREECDKQVQELEQKLASYREGCAQALRAFRHEDPRRAEEMLYKLEQGDVFEPYLVAEHNNLNLQIAKAKIRELEQKLANNVDKASFEDLFAKWLQPAPEAVKMQELYRENEKLRADNYSLRQDLEELQWMYDSLRK